MEPTPQEMNQRSESALCNTCGGLTPEYTTVEPCSCNASTELEPKKKRNTKTGNQVGRPPKKEKEPKPPKEPRVKKTDDPEYQKKYFKIYYEKNKEKFFNYSVVAKQYDYHCDVCNAEVKQKHGPRHNRSKRHLARLAAQDSLKQAPATPPPHEV